MLENSGMTVAKVVALAGGAVLGALLARWCDALLTEYMHEKSEYDKTRYAQGLTPLTSTPKNDPPQDTNNRVQ